MIPKGFKMIPKCGTTLPRLSSRIPEAQPGEKKPFWDPFSEALGTILGLLGALLEPLGNLLGLYWRLLGGTIPKNLVRVFAFGFSGSQGQEKG